MEAMEDQENVPPKKGRRHTFPKKIPFLLASDKNPISTARNKLLQRNRTRRHRENKKKMQEEEEASQSQSLIPSSVQDDQEEQEYSPLGTMGMFEDGFHLRDHDDSEQSSEPPFDGNAQVYEWDSYPLGSPRPNPELYSQPILPPDDSQESVGNNIDFPSEPSGLYIDDSSDTDSSASDDGGGSGQETPGNHRTFPPRTPTLQEELDNFARDVAKLKATSNISDNAMEKAFKLFHAHRGPYAHLVAESVITPSYKNSVRPLLVRQLPRIRCAVKVLRVHDGTATAEYRTGLTGIPRELEHLPVNERVLYSVSFVTVRDIKEHYLAKHLEAGIPRELVYRQLKLMALSSDAVEETKKGRRKFHAVTIKLGSDVYLAKMFHPLVGDDEAKPSAEELIGDIVDQIWADPDLKLRWYIGDTPERHTIKGLKATAGYHSCEMCLAKGEHAGCVWWPAARTMDAPERTDAFMRVTARNFDTMSEEDRKGVVGPSPLARLHYFDVVWDSPAEEFHLVKEGYYKAQVTGLLYSSQRREVVELAEEYSFIYANMRVLSEHSRRARVIRIKKMKGNELGVMLMCTVPSLADILPKEGHWHEAAKSLLVFFFLVRLYYQDEQQYKKGKHAMLRRGITLPALHKYLYEKHEEAFCHFGQQRDTINIHHFHHLWKSRERNGPLWQTSAEPFESLFGALKRQHKPGTRNTPKQVMENHWIHETFAHDCKFNRKMHLAPRATDKAKVDDSLLYNHEGEVFKLKEVSERDGKTVYRCHRVLTEKFKPWQLNFHLPWDDVGVKRYAGITEEEEIFLSGDQIKGKATQCDEILTFWQTEWIMSTSC